jgi:hypothetical protein
MCPARGANGLCSQGPSTQKHALRLFRSLDLRRHVGEYPSHALCEVPRANRARGQPHRLRHRLSKREKRRKREASIDPHGEACPWAGRRPDPRDAGKKINGKKRHILVDTLGLLLDAIVHPADIQDRDGSVLVLSALFGMYPFPRTAATKGRSFERRWPKRFRISKSQSSNAPIRQKASRFSRDAGCRAYICLVQSMPPIGQGFRKSHPQCLGILASRLDPPHAQKAL